MKRRGNGFVITILLLAILGFVTTVVSNPLWLLKQIVIYGAIAGIIFLIFRYFIKKRMGREYSAYSKAAKQSKRRFDVRKTRSSTVKNINQAKKAKANAIKKKKSQPSHLTVIEGKKGKKKNRAFF
ncbi:SA1362 family protein [Metabacillus sp. HB246100]|nr:SA1362 family protein [Bacillus weihaiensis]